MLSIHRRDAYLFLGAAIIGAAISLFAIEIFGYPEGGLRRVIMSKIGGNDLDDPKNDINEATKCALLEQLTREPLRDADR